MKDEVATLTAVIITFLICTCAGTKLLKGNDPAKSPPEVLGRLRKNSSEHACSVTLLRCWQPLLYDKRLLNSKRRINIV